MITVFDLPGDAGPSWDELRRDPPPPLPPSPVAEMRRRIALASAVSLWVRGRVSLAAAARMAGARQREVMTAAMGWRS